MLISHMSEDDEITLGPLSMRASVRKGLLGRIEMAKGNIISVIRLDL